MCASWRRRRSVYVDHEAVPEEPVEQIRGMILAAVESADLQIHENIYQLLDFMPRGDVPARGAGVA